ncbi:phosphoinositide phosphatase SAC6-like isoform X2 [Salvia splendens]|nr:phosphoinositide phosphatase SAC6-like isoform X2 [Salvia splendens]
MRLWEFPDQYVVEPTDGSSASLLAVSRLDGSMNLVVWAFHGDDVSIQYSGTPALKGDFVRCGKRTIQGILNDGFNAVMRYFLNNFVDGTKQDVVDLVQGHYIVSVIRSMTPSAQKGGIEAVAVIHNPFHWL